DAEVDAVVGEQYDRGTAARVEIVQPVEIAVEPDEGEPEVLKIEVRVDVPPLAEDQAIVVPLAAAEQVDVEPSQDSAGVRLIQVDAARCLGLVRAREEKSEVGVPERRAEMIEMRVEPEILAVIAEVARAAEAVSRNAIDGRSRLHEMTVPVVPV